MREVIYRLGVETSSGILVNFLSIPHSNRHKNCLNMSCCDRFSDFYIKSSSFGFEASRKRVALVLNDSKSKGWEKIRVLV